MNDLAEIQKYRDTFRPKGILIDANALVLLFIGSVDIDLITRNKRTSRYSKSHYEALLEVIKIFGPIYVSPMAVAEAGNLLDDFKGENLPRLYESMLATLGAANESHPGIKAVINGHGIDVIIKFGLTDASLLEIIKNENIPLLTDDFKLAGLCLKNSQPAICLFHLVPPSSIM